MKEFPKDSKEVKEAEMGSNEHPEQIKAKHMPLLSYIWPFSFLISLDLYYLWILKFFNFILVFAQCDFDSGNLTYPKWHAQK